MNNPDLSIIIVSYNTREITLECLRSVFNETCRTSFEVVVFDNASSDNSADAIEVEFGDKVKLIRSDKNYGFALGNNKASDFVTGKLLLLLNPDTIVLDNAIDNIVEYSYTNKECGIWGGRTLFPDMSPNPASCWSKQTLWSLFCQAIGLTTIFRKTTLFNPEGIGGWDRRGTRYVDIVAGCFLLIKMDLWVKLDGFGKDFFMYGEEVDLCLRASNIGATPVITDKATIIHYGGASEKVKADKMVRLLNAKNQLIKLHFNKNTTKVAYFLLYLWPVSRYIAHLVLSIFGRSSSKQSYLVWSEILSRKTEWSLF